MSEQQDLERIILPARQDEVSQATQIEQSRAIAEVQSMAVIAQHAPRSITQAVQEMRESCRQPGLAERAFFKFPRAGQTVSGASVHLARELARIWRNVTYGIAELRRDDLAGMSEMMAFAWDIQTNTRNSTTFIVPHKRDTKKGVQDLTDMRDVYENNANLGARRVREMIFAILPPWFVDEAKQLCAQTLRDGGGKPLAQRVADALRMFGEVGVTRDQLEQKVGASSDDWTDQDVAHLGITYRSIQTGEISKDEEFPPRRVTVAEIESDEQQPAQRKTARKQTEPEPDQPETLTEDWPEPAPVGGAR